MKMNKVRFYIAWFDGSDSACGDSTGVHTIDDLIPVHKNGGEVTMYEYEAPEGFEWAVGAAKAFHDNFTAHDTTSTFVVVE